MKKLLILSIGLFAYACGDAGNNTEGTTNADESVEIGSGEEITPQLDFEEDTSSTLKVDTISGPGGTETENE